MQGKLRCAIYTRVSTDNQAEVEFNSCEAQEAKIRSFIQSQENMEVYKVYSDAGFTGANLNRPALTDLLFDVQQNKINLVIAYKIDRLTRSPKDFYSLIELFDKFQVDFISVTERFDTSTPAGRLLRNIMLTFAQFERELTSERTKDKMIERANKGMWNGGMIPLGYTSQNKKLVPNEKEAKIVYDIFERYISSQSLSKVYEHLKTTVKTDISFSKSRISYILRNILYTGKINYGGKIYQGNHPSIISEEVFNLAQEIHKEKVCSLRLYKDYSLAGLIVCQECGSFMTPCHSNKLKNGKRNRYYYYRCTKTFKQDWNACETRQVNANRLEDYIFQNLERISLDKHYLDSLAFKINNSDSGGHAGLELSAPCPYLITVPIMESAESCKIHPQTVAENLKTFVKGLSGKHGIERNLWAKKFINKIKYSKDEIELSLYYQGSSEKASETQIPSGRVGATAGKNEGFAEKNKVANGDTLLKMAPPI